MARLTAQGIQKPTPVQEAAIPLVLQGRDVIGQAQTGTGKTLAFVLPMLDRINVQSDKLQGLIVTPTRELALQITNEVKKLVGPEEGIRVLPVYGGQDVEAQLLKLKGNIHLIIATPGRLLDHLRRETVSLFSVQMLVLDEADQMLHMGFLGEVEEILRNTSSQRQTLLFSATMPATIRELASRILRKPEEVTVKAKQVTVKDISQLVIETTDRAKQSALVETIKDTRPYLGMIFCRTKRRASTLNEALQQMGFESDELHGDLSQAKREQVMKRFREAKLQLLVATDVAARGLDVDGVTHVYNYDIPHDVESYIHRIGRTGRAGGSGMAITFVAPKDRPELAKIESGIDMKIQRQSYGSYITEPDMDGEEGSFSRGGGVAGGRSKSAAQGSTRGGGRAGNGRSGSGSGRGGAARGGSSFGGTSASRGGGFKKPAGASGRTGSGGFGRAGSGAVGTGKRITAETAAAAQGRAERDFSPKPEQGARGQQAGGSRRDSRGGRGEGAAAFGREAAATDRRHASAGAGRGFGGEAGGRGGAGSRSGSAGRGASARGEQGGGVGRGVSVRGEQGGGSRGASARGEQGGRGARGGSSAGGKSGGFAGGRSPRGAGGSGNAGGNRNGGGFGRQPRGRSR